MSAAAEELAAACTHPKVKGSPRALLNALAKRIPDGQTMTAPITDKELAAVTGYDERTIRTARDVLEEVGVIRVDGGQGRPATYELLALPGAGAPPELPLRADLREAPKREPAPTPLFDVANEVTAVDEDQPAPTGLASTRAYTVGSFFRRVVKQPRIFFPMFVGNFGSFFRSGRHVLQDDRPTTKYVHLDLRSGAEKTVGGGAARARDATTTDDGTTADAFLTWFSQTYPSANQGALYRIDADREGPLVGALLRSGYSLAHLEAMTLLLWEVTSDGVVNSDRWWIAERVRVRGIRVLHQKANFLDAELRRRALVAARDREGQLRLVERDVDPTAVDNDIWVRTLARIERQVTRHQFYTWFRHTVLVRDRGDVIEVGKPGDGSDLVADWLQRHFAGVVQEAIAAERPGTRVEFVVVTMEQRRSAS
jgi:hypothetical protein